MPRLYGRFDTGYGQLPVLGSGGPINAYEPSAEEVANMKVGDLVPAGLPEIEYFRLLKNGTTAAVANELQEGQTTLVTRPGGASNANVAPARVGTNKVTFLVVADYAKDFWAGGLITLINGGVPRVYPIVSSTVTTATSRRITITIDGVLLTASTVNTVVMMITSPYNRGREGTVSAHDAIGVPLIAIPASNYYLGVAKGRVVLKLTADHDTPDADEKMVYKAAGGAVALVDDGADSTEQREPIGRVHGVFSTTNTTYGRWAIIDIDLT